MSTAAKYPRPAWRITGTLPTLHGYTPRINIVRVSVIAIAHDGMAIIETPIGYRQPLRGECPLDELASTAPKALAKLEEIFAAADSRPLPENMAGMTESTAAAPSHPQIAAA